MRIAGTVAVRPVKLGKKAHGKAGRTVAALRPSALRDRSLRFAQLAAGRQTFNRMNLLAFQ